MYAPVSQAFQSAGNKGKYQYLVMLLLFTINAFVNFILIGPTFIFMNPLFNCSFSDTLLDESQACNRINQCTINNDFTIVARLGLYCDKQVERNTIQSVLAFGSVIGLIVVNFIADQKGRRKALLLVQFVAIIGFSVTTVGAEYRSLTLLIIGQLLCGFGGYSMMLTTYLYPYECCEQSFRQRAIVSVNYSWCLTFSLIGILYYWCNYWRTFLLYFATIPLCIVFLITLFFLVEGPNFLFRKESLRFIAKINGRTKQFQQIEQNIKNIESDDSKQAGVYQNLKLLFKNKKYIRTVLILAAAQLGGNLYYFGSNYAFDQIGMQYGTNLIAAGIIQVFGFASLNFVIHKIPRKKSLIISYGIMGVIGLLFVFSAVRQSTVATAIILGILRYLGTIAYMIIIITLTEAFPMNVQSICSGFVESVAQIGILLGPIAINVCINLQINPIVVLSVILFITVVGPMFGLEETLKTHKNSSEALLNSTQEAKIKIDDNDNQ